MARITRTLLSGFLLLLPLALTAAVGVWLVTVLERFVGPDSEIGRILISIGLSLSASSAVAYVLGVFIVVVVVYLLGLIVESRLRPWLYGLIEGVMRRIPFVSNVYDLSKRFVAIIDRKEGNDLKRMRPVWCFFGGEGGAAVLALLPTPEPVMIGKESYQGVLVPSAPVPVGGCLIYVPAHWIRPAEGGVEMLMSVYVSMGVTSPQALRSGPQTALPAGSAGKIRTDTGTPFEG